MKRLPVSAVVPTKDRSEILRLTLASLERQEILPAELIVVDASAGNETQRVLREFSDRVFDRCLVIWIPAATSGAAVQRDQGVGAATQPVIWFFDDDIRFEVDCVARLWAALQSDDRLGGVSAMITNQHYGAPSTMSRWMFGLMAGGARPSYAGCVLGPAVNLLPSNSEQLPEVVAVEWLNLTCTAYRRRALPQRLFSAQFTGYSIMEDLTLSVIVGRDWGLANARTARIYHDSQPGSHKDDPGEMARMVLVNRYYVMTRVLGRRRWRDFAKLGLWVLFSHLSAVRDSAGRATLLARLSGEFRALRDILSMRSEYA
ncbi:MAG: glycosyltransferase [Thermoanaerobaculia bacterium]